MFVSHRFTLREDTKDFLRSLTPKFGYDGFGEATFYRTYSRIKSDGGQENWADVVIRNTEGTFSIRKDWYIKNHISWYESDWQEYAARFARAMFRMWWLPPGRGLWAMGSDFVYQRGAMALYNCFSGDTQFLTVKGLLTLSEAVDTDVYVVTSDSMIKKATVKAFGIQKLQKVTFKPVKTENGGSLGKSNLRLSYDVTRNHRWILPNGSFTTDLKVGNRVMAHATQPFDLDRTSQEFLDGFAHGLTFGDGTQQTEWPDRYSIRLCTQNSAFLKDRLEKASSYRTTCRPPSYGGDFVITFVTQKKLKEVPQGCSLNYLRGFFEGWNEADSSENVAGTLVLASSNHDAIEWAIKTARLAGFIPTGLNYDNRDTNFGVRTYPLAKLSLQQQDCLFEVCSITDEGREEEVFCVVEPETKSFVLAGGLVTGNCAYTDITDAFENDIAWSMDSLMHGVGVGAGPIRNDEMELKIPRGRADFIIEDTRESWVESVWMLLSAYKRGNPLPRFIYDKIRGPGLPIKGFGGLSSGPAPLMFLHEQIISTCEQFKSRPEFDSIRFKVDLMNHTGCCVVAGNVRRSAELMCATVRDKTFLDLKNYEKNPDREDYGWMSNNSAILKSDEDFSFLSEIARRVIIRGEPGYINQQNLRFGRIGKHDKVRRDKAKGFNPCGEIPLEHREVCNVDETCPTVCQDEYEWYEACEHATFYCSTVSLLPTHQPSTNRVVARNRRIGVSIIDIAGWRQREGVNQVTKFLREGYRRVRQANSRLNLEAGIRPAIRVTTVKPGGTVPKLPGRNPGMSHPNFPYMIRRMRVQKGSPFERAVIDAGYHHEPDVASRNTTVIEFPLDCTGVKPVAEITLWEQAMMLVWLQREWADNAVSNTLNFRPRWSKIAVIKKDFENQLSFYTDLQFDSIGLAKDMIEEKRDWWEKDDYRIVFDYGKKPSKNSELREIHIYQFDPNHEEDQIEAVLSAIAPLSKSVALMPFSNKGAYEQMPEEGIEKHEYHQRKAELTPIDWSKFSGSDGLDEKFCSGPICGVP